MENHCHCKGTGKFHIGDVSIPQRWEQCGGTVIEKSGWVLCATNHRRRGLPMIDEQCYQIHDQCKCITMYPEHPDVTMVPTYYNLYGHELPKDPYFWKNSKKHYCIPKMIATVYIVDDNIDRLHHMCNLFQLPIGRIYGAQFQEALLYSKDDSNSIHC